ncbi:unnamed protein product [Ascophyllum nodosum]
MSSPGGPRNSVGRVVSPFFSACTGKSHENKVPKLGLTTKLPLIGQQTVCIKCNRHFTRSPNALPSSCEYERCEQCRNFDVGEWIQDSCVIV